MYTAVMLMRAPVPDKVGAPRAAAAQSPALGILRCTRVPWHTDASVSQVGINLPCTSIPPEQLLSLVYISDVIDYKSNPD